MKKSLILLTGAVLTTFCTTAQEIIPFPDLSEHYNFRNNGGERIEEIKYSHLPDDYRKSLSALDEEIKSLEKRLSAMEPNEKEALQNELEGLRNKRSAIVEEAELRSDLLKFY